MKHLLALTLLLSGILSNNVVNAQTRKTGKALLTGPLGVQAYTYRNSGTNPIPILDTIRSLGITEMEGLLRAVKPDGTPYTDEEQVALMKERGIRFVSNGIGFDQLRSDDEVRKVARHTKALGGSYVMCAWINHDGTFDKADADRAIGIFNRAGKLMKEEGVTFVYHCHGYEFQPHENGTLFDYMAERMPAEDVAFEVDIMWAFFGGQDPAALILKYGDRVKLLHVKDLKKGVQGNASGQTDVLNDVAVGDGQLDIPAVMRAAKKVGVKHYLIEDESPLHAAQIPRTIKYLRGLKE